MRATSRLTGKAIPNIAQQAGVIKPRCRACAASRLRAPRRSSWASPFPIRRPSPRRSASAIPRAGKARPRRWRSRTALIESVTDEEILAAYAMTARMEGLFAEPASTAPVAGLLRMGRRGLIPKGSLVTLTLTGHGLKDPGHGNGAERGLRRRSPNRTSTRCWKFWPFLRLNVMILNLIDRRRSIGCSIF